MPATIPVQLDELYGCCIGDVRHGLDFPGGRDVAGHPQHLGNVVQTTGGRIDPRQGLEDAYAGRLLCIVRRHVGSHGALREKPSLGLRNLPSDVCYVVYGDRHVLINGRLRFGQPKPHLFETTLGIRWFGDHTPAGVQ